MCIVSSEEVEDLTLQQQLDLALTYSGTTRADIAKSLGTSPSAFNQRIKTGKFTKEELEKIAAIMDCKYECSFTFSDGRQF